MLIIDLVFNYGTNSLYMNYTTCLYRQVDMLVFGDAE